MWTRTSRSSVAVLLCGALLAGCGDGGDETATDPADPADPADPPAVDTTPPREDGAGSYPDFGPTTYRFTVEVSCFCPDAGVPIRVTVEDDEVTEAVYAASGRGFVEGDPAPDHRAVTIDEVIAAANDTGAESVRVDWPEGQAYPREVYVDRSKRIADEEIGYVITDVDEG